MLSPEELAALESILERARASLQPTSGAEIAVGDVVQLRPGADRTWECSLMLVTQIVNGEVRGQILRPNRSGAREAWGRYTVAEVVRVGRTHYPEPAPDIRRTSYSPPCHFCLRKPPGIAGGKPATTRDATALYRDQNKALFDALSQEQMTAELQEQEAKPKKAKRNKKPA